VRITEEEIKALNPCKNGYEWYLKNQSDDLLTLLLRLNDHRPEWARWLFSRKMNTKQKRLISIFAAEQVLHLFEKKYPCDDRPRKAIEAAKVVLISDSVDNRDAAAYAAYAAYAAADAAANAAYAAADAAANAAYAAADAVAGRKEMQVRIIKEAVRILESGEHK